MPRDEGTGEAGKPPPPEVPAARTSRASEPPPPRSFDGLSGRALLDAVLADAVAAETDTVLIEPRGEAGRVRHRRDGVLMVRAQLAAGLNAGLVAELRRIAELPAPGSRVPESGLFNVRVNGRSRSISIEIVPTLRGESARLGILAMARPTHALESLGMEPRTYGRFRARLQERRGLVLATGPLRSGKSLLQYLSLQSIAGPDVSIMIAEDPPQFDFPEAGQVACDFARGLTFAACARSFVRADADVFMVGEIRDYETAEAVIQAVLQGRMAFAGMHTSSAPATLGRLLDMGVEPYQLRASVAMIANLRQVRVLCNACKQVVAVTPGVVQEMRIDSALLDRLELSDVDRDPMRVGRAGSGCAACAGTGYHGRTGLFELLEMSEELGEAVSRSARRSELVAIALAGGMLTTRMSGLRKALLGITSLEEVVRVTHRDP